MKKRQLMAITFALAAIGASAQAQQRSLTIDELFSLVEQSSKSLRSTKAGVDVAAKAVEEARSQRLPDINASLSLSYNGNVVMMDRDFSDATGFSSPHFGNCFALEARQTIYAGGAVNAGIKLAELHHEQAQTAVDQSRDAQRFIALSQYLDLCRMANAIKVYESNIELTKRLIDDIKAKQAQGMALKNDVTRYELQMETLKLGLRKAEDQRDVINYELNNTLGIQAPLTSPQGGMIKTELQIIPNIDLDNLEAILPPFGGSEMGFSASPVIRQSQLGIDIAKSQLKLAKSEMLPKLAVVAVDNFNGPFTYDVPPIDKNFNVWYVGVGINYSLSSLFKGNKGVRRAEASLVKSHDDYNVATESIDNQLQSAQTMFEQSKVELRTQQKSVELARQNYEVINDRYLNQLALITDMIDASNVRLNAELQEVNARINMVYTYYKIKYIAGEI